MATYRLRWRSLRRILVVVTTWIGVTAGATALAWRSVTFVTAQVTDQPTRPVNVVAPGGLETDFGGGALRDIPEVKAFITSQTALGRTGVPEDVGPVIAALFADSHRWVTGQKIDASGGWFL